VRGGPGVVDVHGEQVTGNDQTAIGQVLLGPDQQGTAVREQIAVGADAIGRGDRVGVALVGGECPGRVDGGVAHLPAGDRVDQPEVEAGGCLVGPAKE
jgi:hypothetical protein